MNIKSELELIIKQALTEGLYWDFYEEHEDAERLAWNTVPGRIINHLLLSNSDPVIANRIIGLSVANAARRSLACWFVYCDDDFPLYVINQIIRYWISHESEPSIIQESWLKESVPTEQGIPIRDCRLCDTGSASAAVAYAARFAYKKTPFDAIVSLSSAFNAFDQSPIGPAKAFVQWLLAYAVPVSMEGRRMTSDEEFARVDYQIPEVMLKEYS